MFFFFTFTTHVPKNSRASFEYIIVPSLTHLFWTIIDIYLFLKPPKIRSNSPARMSKITICLFICQMLAKRKQNAHTFLLLLLLLSQFFSDDLRIQIKIFYSHTHKSKTVCLLLLLYIYKDIFSNQYIYKNTNWTKTRELLHCPNTHTHTVPKTIVLSFLYMLYL